MKSIRRRRVCRALAAFPAMLAVAAAAQPSSPYRIAWVTTERKNVPSANFDAFRGGLRDMGYVEGRNIAIDVWSGDGSGDRITQMAPDILASRPDVVVAAGGLALFALVKAGVKVPVVFSISADPVEAKIVASFARPGGNLTGISLFTLALVGKRLELLKEIVPKAKRVALVVNPQHPGERLELATAKEQAARLGMTVRYFPVTSEADLESALADVARSRDDAILAFADGFTLQFSGRIAAFSQQQRIPAIDGWAEFARAGNLFAYGPEVQDVYRRLATYVDRIRKGAAPGDLPIELPTKVQLTVNAVAAKQLGITIPSVGARACGRGHPLMQRRDFVAALFAAAAGGAGAQASRGIPVVAYLHPASAQDSTIYQRLVPDLARLGYVDGKTVKFDIRSGDGVSDALPKLVDELLARNPDVLIVVGPAAVKAAIAATRTTAIVAVDLESDPVEAGWMKSLSRPGGNVTGLFLDLTGMSVKWLQLLREAVPGVRDIALVWDPATGGAQLAATRAAAGKFDFHARTVPIDDWSAFDATIEAALRTRTQALVVLSSPIAFQYSAKLAALTKRHRVPAISPFRAFAVAGGLMSYGPDLDAFFLRASDTVDRILRGLRPSDIAVQQPLKYDLVINDAASRSLGLALPRPLLLRADEVIR